MAMGRMTGYACPGYLSLLGTVQCRDGKSRQHTDCKENHGNIINSALLHVIRILLIILVVVLVIEGVSIHDYLKLMLVQRWGKNNPPDLFFMAGRSPGHSHPRAGSSSAPGQSAGAGFRWCLRRSG